MTTTSHADQTTDYIKTSLENGATPEGVIQALIANGWSPSDAESAVTAITRTNASPTPSALNIAVGSDLNAPSQSTDHVLHQAAARAAAKRQIMFGLFWLVGGIVATAIGYTAASEAGGSYMVFYGAIVWGAIDTLRGLAAYSSA